MRKPTKDEQLDGWKNFAFQLNLHRNITMNHDGVIDCLNRLDSWVNAHSTSNGERSDKDVEKNIAEAFWKYISRSTPQSKQN